MYAIWPRGLHSLEPSLAFHPTDEKDHAEEDEAQDGGAPAGVHLNHASSTSIRSTRPRPVEVRDFILKDMKT